MKKLQLLALGVTVVTSLHADIAATSMKIGVVEIQKIFSETIEGKEVHEILIKKQQELTKELQREGQAYGARLQEFEKRAKEGLESESALMKRRMELESKERELKEKQTIAGREFEYYQQELQQKRMVPFRETIKTTIEKQAIKDGLDVVFVRETGEAIYVNPRIDMTAPIMKQLDAQYSTKGDKKAAPAKPVVKAEPQKVPAKAGA